MKAFIPYIFVLLALLVHLTQSQGDKCSEPCIVGQTDYFKPPAYGAYGLGYVHSPEQPPLLNVQSSAITTGVIIIHGNSGDVNNYYCWMKWALQSIGKDATSYIVAPHFVILEDGPAPEAMYWNTGTWKQGGLSALRPRIASFQVLDDMLVVFANKTLFPSLKDILVVGHSAGGQTVQRYALSTPIDPVIKALNVTLRYIAENSGSFAYLDTARPILPNITLPTCTACNATAIPQRNYSFAPVSNETKASCPAYNDWRMGLDNGLAYLTARSLADVRAEYRYKDVTYVHGSNDTCNTDLGNCGCNDNTLDKGCDGMLQGFCRFDRGWIFYRYLKYYYGEQVHNIAVVPGVGHDGCRMLNSDVSLNIMFPPTTDCGVEFSQTKINSWTSYGEPWSQWQATMRVGAKPLYSVEILTSHTAESFYPWNINLVPGTTNIYTLPRYHYNYGVIPAGSSYVTFGYTLSSPNASTITLNNRACIPKPCPVGLTPWFQSSRVAGSYTYKNYVLQANNTSPTTSNALITLQLNFYGGAFVQSSSYLNPSTSSAGTTTQNFICSRSPQSTCTYTISVLTSNVLPVNHEVSTVQSICL